MKSMTATSIRGSSELYGVQMLRAAAAIAVVIHHALEHSNGAASAFSPDWLTTSGASGVDIFFVISGFIMLSTSFRTEQPATTPGSFLFRRATRIYPFYWLCCLAMLGIMSAGFLKNHPLQLLDIDLSLALLPSNKMIIGVSWTLVFEVYFYLLFAATLWLASAFQSALLTTITIGLFGAIGHMLDDGPLRDLLINPIPCEFAFGLWLALAFQYFKAERWRKWLSPAWAFPCVALLALAPLFVAHDSTAGLTGWSRVIAWGLPATLIVAAFLTIGRPQNALQRLGVFLGDASYAIYLTHAFVMIGYGFILKKSYVSHLPQIVIVPLIVLLSLIIGVAAHVMLEKPMLTFIRRWTPRRQPQ